MNTVVSLKTHEIIVDSSIAHYVPGEKGLMRSFNLDLHAEEHTGDHHATKVPFIIDVQSI